MRMNQPKPDTELTQLLEEARHHDMTPLEHRLQRRSFAAGNIALHTGEPIEVVRARVDAVDEEIYGPLPEK